MIEGWPLPSTDDPLDRPFWEASARGELRVQKCEACSRLRFPPRPVCPWCRSFSTQWAQVSGRGTLWSFVVSHPPLLPAFAELAPYPVIVVELEEDPTIRMVGNLVATAEGQINEVELTRVEIGAALEVVFYRATDDVSLPRWTLAPFEHQP